MPNIRVELPLHLRRLASLPTHELILDVSSPATIASTIDAIERRYPMLCGTIRDHVTKERRPLVRFYACSEDLSHQPPDAPLPDAVAQGREPFLVVASIAGG